MAEEAERRAKKKALVDRLQAEKDRLHPFAFFTGVRDNPLPYERMYIKMQQGMKKQLRVRSMARLELPVIKKNLNNPFKSVATSPKVAHG